MSESSSSPITTAFKKMDSKSYRFTILALNCLLTLGSYYCFDMPSNLENQIKDQIIGKFDEDNVNLYYNYFYLVYSWTNMIMSLVAGVMVDKLGREKCMYLFVTECVIGAAIYALGAYLINVEAEYRYGIMFLGRFIFGLGGGPITIVQNCYTTLWFTGYELALAFGCTLTVSRIGSVINFDVTPSLYKAFGGTIDEEKDGVGNQYALAYTLFCGAALTFLSLFAAYYLNRMDKAAEVAKAGPYKETAESKIAKRKKMSFQDVKEFPIMYWMLAITISIFYSIIFPFMANSSSFLQTEKFGLGADGASFRSGLVYMCSMFVSPFLGGFVDWFGRRTQIALIGVSFTIPCFLLLARTSVDPVYSMLLLGGAYSVCASSLWPSIQLLVPLRTTGTANGLATSIQMFGIGITNIVVGLLRDDTTFTNVMYFFLCLGIACVVIVFSMFFLDHDGKMKLGKRDIEKEEVDISKMPLLQGVQGGDEQLV